MDLDEVILVIDAQMPIRARRVKYFEDPALNVLHAGQSGSFPYPDEDGLRRDRQMSETRETVDRLKQELQEVRAAAGARGSAAASTAAEEPATDPQVQKLASTSRARGRAARAAAPVGGSGQVSFDLDRLGIKWANRTELTAAVQTTKAIIAEHG